VHHVGVDIIEIARIEDAVGDWGERFLRRVYAPSELELCCGKSSSLAVRFAGKEAVMKALGTGARIDWKEIEILAHPNGQPFVRLSGKAQARAAGLGIAGFSISLSHSREYAVAVAIGETG